MSQITTIKEHQQDKMSAMFKELGIFFAFSNEQYEKGRKDGVKSVSMGAGMLVPKDHCTLLRERFDQILQQTAQEFNALVPMDDYIHYELANHEAFYTGNYHEILELVQGIYPECALEDVERVYRTADRSDC